MQKKYIYVNRKYLGRENHWDSSHIADIIIGYKPWNKMFDVLVSLDPDNDFFASGQTEANNFRKWDVIAAGSLYIHKGSINGKQTLVYYPCSTVVRRCHRKKGNGDLLYKTLLLTANNHATVYKKRNWLFAPHVSMHGSTSLSASRCYNSLERKGYLTPILDKKYNCLFKVKRIPKNIKPVYY